MSEALNILLITLIIAACATLVIILLTRRSKRFRPRDTFRLKEAVPVTQSQTQPVQFEEQSKHLSKQLGDAKNYISRIPPLKETARYVNPQSGPNGGINLDLLRKALHDGPESNFVENAGKTGTTPYAY